MNNSAFILLGSNLGDRAHALLVARQEVSITAGAIVQLSSIYETAAWGNTSQPGFLNQVMEIETLLSPSELMSELLSIEEKMGRVRSERWGPRVIDLDILFYGDIVVQTETLTIPHPAIPSRRFTLAPLNEIAPGLVHPILGTTVRELLFSCQDALDVKRVSEI